MEFSTLETMRICAVRRNAVLPDRLWKLEEKIAAVSLFNVAAALCRCQAFPRLTPPLSLRGLIVIPSEARNLLFLPHQNLFARDHPVPPFPLRLEHPLICGCHQLRGILSIFWKTRQPRADR